ncbi:Crp/Fnr family transcriptional regulator [Maribacter sp.]|nr:Crp/Fnr family transcriptional regulator [Maribacter sp.]
MEHLRKCISNQVEVDKESMDSILSGFEIRKIKKGEYLLEAGKVCQEMAYIDSGYLRMFDLVDGKEITFWIGSSGKFITSLSSFVFKTSNFWSIQAVTDCNLFVINRERHFVLSKTEPKWLEFDNILLARSFALLEQTMFAQLHTTAQQRFNHLLKEEPALFNHVPLQYIASMLGITPESLSRLRKKLANTTS